MPYTLWTLLDSTCPCLCFSLPLVDLYGETYMSPLMWKSTLARQAAQVAPWSSLRSAQGTAEGSPECSQWLSKLEGQIVSHAGWKGMEESSLGRTPAVGDGPVNIQQLALWGGEWGDWDRPWFATFANSVV